jgi:hypothetical protein
MTWPWAACVIALIVAVTINAIVRKVWVTKRLLEAAKLDAAKRQETRTAKQEEPR